MSTITGVVFDMDDTLVAESDYVRSGFRAVAAYCGECSTVYSDEVASFLLNCFESGVRGNTFNLLFEEFDVLAQDTSVEALVEVYRTHQPLLDFKSQVQEMISKLIESGVKLGVISDGPLASQSAKAAALRLDEYFSPVILTDTWGKEFWKPAHRAYEEIEKEWGIAGGGGLVYIGDNPHKDFKAPNERGWISVRLRLDTQLRCDDEPESSEYAPQHEFTSVSALCGWLTANI